jgi:hypothetical protein
MSLVPPSTDNQTGGPERSFPVTHDDLARAVRETFSRQVTVTRPLAADPAGIAIRRASRIRRHRTLAGLALAAVATALVTTGMAQFREPAVRSGTPTVVLGDPDAATAMPSPTRVPTPPASGPVRAETDLVGGGVLDTTGGEQLPLTGLGRVDRAQRVPDDAGWLLTGAPTAAGRTLWLVPRSGRPQVLLAGADAIALSSDGRQVAWRDGGELFTAGIVGSQLVARVQTAAPAGAAPVGFVGNWALIRLDPGRPGYALWLPSAGTLNPAGGSNVLNAYGLLPDGRVVAEVFAGTPRRPCLALLDAARKLAATRTACGPTLGTDGLGAVSSDGRWLLVNGETGGTRAALLVDLTRSTAVARPAGPPLAGDVAWASAQTALYVDGKGGLVRVRVDRVVAGAPASASPATGAAADDPPVVVTGGGS